MTVTAKSVLRGACVTLLDEASVRWPVNDLIDYFNDGQDEVVLILPEAGTTTGQLTLVAGTYQELEGLKLISIQRNTGGPAVRLTDREVMDANQPSWYTDPEEMHANSYMWDARAPRDFYVYPPVRAGVQVEATWVKYPAKIQYPAAADATIDDVLGDMDLPDIYKTALMAYIIFRAYSKDTENETNLQRAAMWENRFRTLLGAELEGTVQAGPNPVRNPKTGTVEAAE